MKNINKLLIGLIAILCVVAGVKIWSMLQVQKAELVESTDVSSGPKGILLDESTKLRLGLILLQLQEKTEVKSQFSEDSYLPLQTNSLLDSVVEEVKDSVSIVQDQEEIEETNKSSNTEEVPEPLTILGTTTALAIGVVLKKKRTA